MSDQPGDLRDRLREVHTYAVTPFRDDLASVDREALAANLDFLVRSGVRVIAVGGGTGEVDALSTGELVVTASTAVETIGSRAVVIATVPGDLGQALELLPAYERLGVDVALALPPLVRWRPPADPAGTIAYYRLLAQRTRLPLLPSNTQGWDAAMFVRLAEVPSVVGVKDPCLDDLPMFRAIQLLGDRFVWIGNKRHDPGIAHLRYQMGMQGFTSGMTNFLPELELQLHVACVAKDWPRAVRLQALAADLERARNASDDAAMIKACMDIVGLHGGRVRPPRTDVEAAVRPRLQAAIAWSRRHRSQSPASAASCSHSSSSGRKLVMPEVKPCMPIW
jgi:dihydrodipicolinate synthase/N-acetylneuraminate lyase